MVVHILLSGNIFKPYLKALSAVRNPLITNVLSSIKNETGQEGTFTLPKMGYEYNQLEPTICEEIMRIHHSKVID